MSFQSEAKKHGWRFQTVMIWVLLATLLLNGAHLLWPTDLWPPSGSMRSWGEESSCSNSLWATRITLVPPLSLQDTVPPTSATSFFVSLGKFGNSLSSRPSYYWWDAIISLSSHPEVSMVVYDDGSDLIMVGNLCLVSGSGLYIFLIINMVAGVFINSSVSNW